VQISYISRKHSAIHLSVAEFQNSAKISSYIWFDVLYSDRN